MYIFSPWNLRNFPLYFFSWRIQTTSNHNMTNFKVIFNGFFKWNILYITTRNDVKLHLANQSTIHSAFPIFILKWISETADRGSSLIRKQHLFFSFCFCFESKLIWKWLNDAVQLAITNRVGLVWVPEHFYVNGNDMADKLTSSHFYGRRPTLGVSNDQIKGQLQQWERRKSLFLRKEICRQLGDN